MRYVGTASDGVELPPRIAELVARVGAGEATVSDAAMVNSLAEIVVEAVHCLAFEDAARTFRALSRLRGWVEEMRS